MNLPTKAEAEGKQKRKVAQEKKRKGMSRLWESKNEIKEIKSIVRMKQTIWNVHNIEYEIKKNIFSFKNPLV